MSQPNIGSNPSSEAQESYLIFRLNDSSYAIPVEHVREIIASVETSPVPGAPEYLDGVVNLRGRILPIVDLRKRFYFPAELRSDRQCCIILMLELEDELTELGIKVDAVSEVARISKSQVDSANGMQDYNESLVFTGVAKTDSGIKLILDSQILVVQLKRDVISQCRINALPMCMDLVSTPETEQTAFHRV